MNRKVLCDTNVWLDYYIGARKGHKTALQLIREGIRNDVAFMVPASCLGDFFYLCQADFKKALKAVYGEIGESQGLAAQEGAWANLAHLLDLATVVGADHGDAYIALKHRAIHGDFEDDLVIAAALRSDADCLVTDDEKLRRNSPVQTLTAEEALAFLGLGDNTSGGVP